MNLGVIGGSYRSEHTVLEGKRPWGQLLGPFSVLMWSNLLPVSPSELHARRWLRTSWCEHREAKGFVPGLGVAGLRAEVGSCLRGWTGGNCPTASVSRLGTPGCGCAVCGQRALEAHCTGSSGVEGDADAPVPRRCSLRALSCVMCAVQGAGGAVRNKECPCQMGPASVAERDELVDRSHRKMLLVHS